MKLSIKHMIRYVLMGSMGGLILLVGVNSAYAQAPTAKAATDQAMGSNAIAVSGVSQQGKLICAANSTRSAGIGPNGIPDKLTASLALLSSDGDPLSLGASFKGNHQLSTWPGGQGSVVVIDNLDGEGQPVEAPFERFVIMVDEGCDPTRLEAIYADGSRHEAHVNEKLFEEGMLQLSGGLLPLSGFYEVDDSFGTIFDKLEAIVRAEETSLNSRHTVTLILLVAAQVTSLGQCLGDAAPFVTYEFGEDQAAECTGDDIIGWLAELIVDGLFDLNISSSASTVTTTP